MNESHDIHRLADRSTILVVEDERAILRLATRVLERAGFGVLPSASADEALEAVEGLDDPPRLVITDLSLPGESGERLAARLRERWPDLPVIFTSGHPDRGENLPDGTSFLAKPFTPSDLVQVVRERLSDPARPTG